jgi:predicted ferric reductase
VGAPGGPLTSLGRLAGLVAADLLLVQVVLMARIPLVERAYGQDELARRHRLVGFWAFTLLLAHIGLISLGYAQSARSGALAELWTILTTYQDMLFAAAGTALLVLVVVTSVRAARRRLRYGRWHLVHLAAYAGVLLTIPHELSTGADFASSPLAQAYWWTIYAVAAGAVAVYRVGLPVWRTLRHGVTVRAVVRETPDVVTVHLTGRDLHRMPVQAGQFFLWRFLDGPGWSEAHPYSLSAAPRRGALRITVKETGDATERLARMRPGTRVLLEGPYGRLTPERRSRERVLMLASGIGITPLYALLEDLSYRPGAAVLVYRAHSRRDLALQRDIERLAERRGITVHYLLGPRLRGRDSWLPQAAEGWGETEALLRLVPDLTDSDVFVCGPVPWMAAVAAAARAAGLPEEQLHQERFAW